MSKGIQSPGTELAMLHAELSRTAVDLRRVNHELDVLRIERNLAVARSEQLDAAYISRLRGEYAQWAERYQAWADAKIALGDKLNAEKVKSAQAETADLRRKLCERIEVVKALTVQKNDAVEGLRVCQETLRKTMTERDGLETDAANTCAKLRGTIEQLRNARRQPQRRQKTKRRSTKQ